VNLVIGNTSQLSYYFPNDYIKISSREVDVDSLCVTHWDSVYICFAEQRTYLANSTDEAVKNLFWDTNVSKTLDIIEKLKTVSKKVVYYSTAELWNKTNGPVKVTDEFSYYKNSYTDSKRQITDVLKDKDKYSNISILYPFNFNGVYRGEKYLMGKIFRSIRNKERITIGDVYYYREMLHPSMVVDASLKSNPGEDMIVGSGRVVYVKDFIQSLYKRFDLKYTDLVIEQIETESIYRKNIFYSSEETNTYNVDLLLEQTSKELMNGELL